MKTTATLIGLVLCLFSFELSAQNSVIWTNLHNLNQNAYGLRYDSTHAVGSTPESKYGSASSLNCLQQLDTGSFWFTIDSVTAQHTLYGFSMSNYIFTDIARNNFPDGQPGTYPGMPFYVDISGGYAHVYDQENDIDSFAVTSGDVIKIAKEYIDFSDPSEGGYLNVYKNGSLAGDISYCDQCYGLVGFNLYIGVVVERNGGGIDPVQCSFGTYSTFGLYDYSITWDSSTFVSAETDTLTVKNSGDSYMGYGVSANKLQGTANGYVQYQVVDIDSGSGQFFFGLLSFKDYSHLGNQNYFGINGGTLQVYSDGGLYGNFGTVQPGDILEIVRYDGVFNWVHNSEVLASSYSMFDYDSPTGDGDYGIHSFFEFYGSGSLFNVTSDFSFPLQTPVITATTSGYCSGSGSPFSLSVSNPQSWIDYKWYKNGTAIANTDSSTHTESSPPSSTTTYQAKIFDKYGDTLSSNIITITVGPIVLSSHLTNVACYGGSNGIDSLFTSNTSGALTYSWSPSGGTNATASSLSGNIYTATVTDGRGCTKTETDTITQPSALSASISGSTNVSCHGASTGSATVAASGGTTSYSYSWSPSGGTNATASGLAAGTYTVTVTDAHSCTTTAGVTITQPSAALSASISSSTNENCYGNIIGAATVSASGGTASYTYSWSPSGGTNTTASSLAAGTYTVTVTDANSCTATATVTITQPSALSASISSSTNVSCHGGSNGAATVNASGGTASYTYSWTSGATTATAGSLSAGTYTVTVTDAHSCSATATVTITQPSVLSASISSSTNVSCHGASTGSATVAASGGTTSYSYSWSGGETNATASSLAPGTYTVTVTDAYSCTASATVSITQPSAALAVSVTGQNKGCHGSDNGVDTITASGGTTPYSYLWSPSSKTTATVSGLTAGTYTTTTTDHNGCTANGTITVSAIPTFSVTATSLSNVSCYDGSDGIAVAAATGGTPPYLYNWEPGYGLGDTVTGLPANTYTVLTIDANYCGIVTATATISQPSASLTSSVSSHTNVSCYGGNNGTATASGSGGTTPYSYSWSTGATTSSISGLSAGTYTVTVNDAHSCGTVTSTVTVSQPSALTANAGSDHTICPGSSVTIGGSPTASGGSGSYLYDWSFLPIVDADDDDSGLSSDDIANPVASPYLTTNYIVTATDANGCSQNDTVLITVNPTPFVIITTSSFSAACDGTYSVILTSSAGSSYLWSTSATTQAITVSSLGNYTVTVTNSSGCSATSATTSTLR